MHYSQLISQAEQKVIVDKHNALRRQVAKGLETRGANGSGPQPIAADMYELVWDSPLAASAQRYTCFHQARFFNVGPLRRTSFLTTFYGLYFSHHYTHITNYNVFSHVGPL